ncbi:MAG: ABC transporter permease [Chloroflexota bacterium]
MPVRDVSQESIRALELKGWRRFFWNIWQFAQYKPLGAFSGFILFTMIMVAILGPLLTPYDPLSHNLPERLSPPSLEHLAGTDQFGRDILSRLIIGTRLAMFIGITAASLRVTSGAIVGVISGYAGKKADMVIQRFMDTFQAFPDLILIIAFIAVLGPSIPNLIIAIAVPGIPGPNRVMRSIALSVKEYQFVEAARAVGASPARIIFRHIVPQCIAAYLILLSGSLGGAIMAESSLGFLGLGVPPPHPAWGASLNEAMRIHGAPWVSIFPGIAISAAIFAANLLGDALRDIWDPRLKRL